MNLKIFLFKIISIILSFFIARSVVNFYDNSKEYYYVKIVIATAIIAIIIDIATKKIQKDNLQENFDLFGEIRKLGENAVSAGTDIIYFRQNLERCNSEKAGITNNLNQCLQQKAQLEARIKELEAKIVEYRGTVKELYNKQLSLINNSSFIGNTQLSDKNRMLVSTNADIQKSFLKLTEVNDKINTITQEIYSNNAAFERKEQIEKTLKAIMFLLLFLMIIMIVYYSSGYSPESLPETFNSIKTSLGFKYT